MARTRIGVGAAMASRSGATLDEVATHMEGCGFDSIWLPDVPGSPFDDPVSALAYVAGRVGRLKLGTTLVLPGRNPVRLARELATLDRVSGGRLLLTVVPGLRRRAELQAMGSDSRGRESEMDELLPLMRALWSGRPVDHKGARWDLRGATVAPTPMQDPLEVWVGGLAAGALRRCGRMADGWLPALCTPEEAAAGRKVVEDEAAASGRSVDPEHFGVSIGYLNTGSLDAVRASIERRRPGVDPALLVPVDLASLRGLIEEFAGVGFSKFVVRPLVAPRSWPAELDALAGAVLDLQG